MLTLEQKEARCKKISESIKKFYLGKPRWNTGKKPSLEARLKSSKSHKLRVAQGKNKLWKGGISTMNKIIRSSIEYSFWRDSVFERDDYTCQVCKRRGCRLNAHHVKPFSKYPELRLEVSNGISLCVKCHNESKGREKWYEEQLLNLSLLEWFFDEMLISSYR